MNYTEKRTVRGPGSGRAKGVGNKRQAIKYHKCDVRLDNFENAALDRLAERYETSRSDVVRKALRDFIRFTTEDTDERSQKWMTLGEG